MKQFIPVFNQFGGTNFLDRYYTLPPTVAQNTTSLVKGFNISFGVFKRFDTISYLNKQRISIRVRD